MSTTTSTPEFFIANAGKYDTYDRNGPKVYVGEYAVTQGCGQGNLRAARRRSRLHDRHGAQLGRGRHGLLCAAVRQRELQEVEPRPDQLRQLARLWHPAYYVQQMFSENRGDVVLPVTRDAPEVDAGARVRRHRRRHLEHAGRVQGHQGHARRRDAVHLRFRQTARRAGRLHGGDWTVQDGALRQNAPTRQRPRLRRRQELDQLHLHPQGAEAGRRRRLPHLVPGARTRRPSAWWNIGGWGNTRHAIEMDGIAGNDVPGSIETGRWYDIRIEVQGASIKCFLDGKLIHDVKLAAELKPLYAVASLAKRANEVILKVVNVSAADQETDLRLEGAKVRPTATAIVLASDKPEDENTLDQPTKVKPVTRTLNNAGAAFRHTFPANSVTVLRLKLQ